MICNWICWHTTSHKKDIRISQYNTQVKIVNVDCTAVTVLVSPLKVCLIGQRLTTHVTRIILRELSTDLLDGALVGIETVRTEDNSCVAPQGARGGQGLHLKHIENGLGQPALAAYSHTHQAM